MPKFKITKKLNDRINSITRGFLEGMPVIRAFNTQDYEEKSFDATNTRIMKNQLFINRMMSLMMPAMMLVMNASSLLIIWVGGHLIESGSIQVGAMMAFIQYANYHGFLDDCNGCGYLAECQCFGCTYR